VWGGKICDPDLIWGGGKGGEMRDPDLTGGGGGEMRDPDLTGEGGGGNDRVG
jgi:hypothetical protein